MANYIINGTEDIKAFINTNIDDERLFSKDANVILILDEGTNEKLYDYYNNVLRLIIESNKLVILIVGKEVKIRKAICNLMASYRNYNMYLVEDRDIIDEDYLSNIIEREPSYEEVQTFIGGDISGYSEISTIVIGINSIINSGELEGLKTFINNHINSIRAFPEIIDYMKKVIDTANSGELLDKIEELKLEASKLQTSLDEYKGTVKKLNDNKEKLTEDLNHAKKDLVRSKSKIDELNEQISSKGTVIKSYPELNTSIMKCKVMHILYFKEVSYVTYMHSLVHSIAEALKARRLKFKLLIYDNQSGLSSIYKPAPVVGSAEYLANKGVFLKSTERLVIVEPNPMIIEDVLTYSQPAFDVVIVYDKLKQVNDIIIGNNVTKYYVVNSYKEYAESKNILKITDASHIITRSGGTLHEGIKYNDINPTKIQVPKERLDIPTIEDYSKITNTAKVSKYMKLVSTVNNKPIINSIFDRMRI